MRKATDSEFSLNCPRVLCSSSRSPQKNETSKRASPAIEEKKEKAKGKKQKGGKKTKMTDLELALAEVHNTSQRLSEYLILSFFLFFIGSR